MFTPDAFAGMGLLADTPDHEILRRVTIADAIERHPVPYVLLPTEWPRLTGVDCDGARFTYAPAVHRQHGLVLVNKAGGFCLSFPRAVTLDEPAIGWMGPLGGLAICDSYQHRALAEAICEGIGGTSIDPELRLEALGYVKIIKRLGALVAVVDKEPTERQMAALLLLGIGGMP